MSTKLTVEDFKKCGDYKLPTDDNDDIDQDQFKDGVKFAEAQFEYMAGIKPSSVDGQFHPVVKFHLSWMANYYWFSTCGCRMNDTARDNYEKAVEFAEGVGDGSHVGRLR